MDDAELLRLYAESKDVSYFGELYKRYIPKIYGTCLKYLGEQEAAKDAVMDIFQTLTEKVLQYEISNFNTWLYSVVKNHCLHVLRKENRVKYINIEDAFVENQALFTLTDKPQTAEEVAALDYCMGTLPEEQHRSIQLFYIEEQSYADIVEITGYALSKVKSYIQNGKRNLKNCILKVLSGKEKITK
ncbi:MAG: sigma-70 family RNA polymerase sigma factor [Paludibacter sp.]|nr:sigma-70 family RNA polymerase sigma factor [Paludibacter sp.]